MVHKKCHKFIKLGCLGHPDYLPYHSNGVPKTTGTKELADLSNISNQLHRIGTPARKHPNRFLDSNNAIEARKARNNLQNATGNFTLCESNIVRESTADYPINEQTAADQRAGGRCQYGLDDFNLLRVIGRGSYSKVLMVELKQTKRIYAMKVIKKSLVKEDEDIDWVQTEKHVFETASNYPFLVGLHSCFQSPSRLFFIIEFVRGGDLMFHMQRQRRLPEEHARFYVSEIALGLNFLHERGIIFRDLKLDNVLLDHEGHIKLTDYGMCKEGIRPGDKTSTFCGTPNYISPEIIRGEDYDNCVDWWALGKH